MTRSSSQIFYWFISINNFVYRLFASLKFLLLYLIYLIMSKTTKKNQKINQLISKRNLSYLIKENLQKRNYIMRLFAKWFLMKLNIYWNELMWEDAPSSFSSSSFEFNYRSNWFNSIAWKQSENFINHVTIAPCRQKMDVINRYTIMMMILCVSIASYNWQICETILHSLSAFSNIFYQVR